MPRMTMAPSAALRTACCMASVKAAVSVTVWSAGVTTSTGSFPPSWAASAASVRAGAVLRPTGSSRAALGSMPASRNCSMARKRCSSLLTMYGAATAKPSPARPARRWAACWNRLSSPVRHRNCLGKPARDKGHKRVPEPPQRITGETAIIRVGLRFAPAVEDRADRGESIVCKIGGLGLLISYACSFGKDFPLPNQPSGRSPQRQKQLERLLDSGNESIVLIKARGSFVFCVHEQPRAADRLRCRAGTVHGVGQQQAAQALSLHVRPCRQAPKTSDGYLARVTLCLLGRQVPGQHKSRGQCIKAKDAGGCHDVARFGPQSRCCRVGGYGDEGA